MGVVHVHTVQMATNSTETRPTMHELVARRTAQHSPYSTVCDQLHCQRLQLLIESLE